MSFTKAQVTTEIVFAGINALYRAKYAPIVSIDIGNAALPTWEIGSIIKAGIEPFPKTATQSSEEMVAITGGLKRAAG